MGVPLTLTHISSNVTQYYVPYLSAIQIFTNKPVLGGSSSRSPLYPIPKVPTMKSLSVFFLTYHSLTPVFPETIPQEETVGLPAFGVVTSELSGKVWNMPGTSDQQNISMLEESAVSWLEKLRFSHKDFDMFMAEKSNAQMPLPRSRTLRTPKWM